VDALLQLIWVDLQSSADFLNLDHFSLAGGISGSSDYKTDTSKKKSVEEMRAERLKREQLEKDRVRKLLVSQSTRSSTGYDRLPNGRVPQYHGSFGNAR
jgi:hypothetical protein